MYYFHHSFNITAPNKTSPWCVLRVVLTLNMDKSNEIMVDMQRRLNFSCHWSAWRGKRRVIYPIGNIRGWVPALEGSLLPCREPQHCWDHQETSSITGHCYAQTSTQPGGSERWNARHENGSTHLKEEEFKRTPTSDWLFTEYTDNLHMQTVLCYSQFAQLYFSSIFLLNTIFSIYWPFPFYFTHGVRLCYSRCFYVSFYMN